MKRILLIAALVSALGAIKMAANPQVQHFIHYYRQMDDDMGFIPRTIYSWLLAKRAD